MSTPSHVTVAKFDHLQLYVDSLKPLEHYKAIETRLNDFSDKADLSVQKNGRRDIATARSVWESTGDVSKDPAQYQPHGQDFIEQLLYGFGWRVTAVHSGPETISMVVSTNDATGSKYVVTAPTEQAADGETYDHFLGKHVQAFKQAHRGAQGFGVLCFEIPAGEMEVVMAKYQTLHPKLLMCETPYSYTQTFGDETVTTQIIDAYAYYLGEKGESEPDIGTTVRYISRSSSTGNVTTDRFEVLPGLSVCPATFDGTSLKAYNDHWVSNVNSRKSFLATMGDILGFEPKVDFNAGVVAAGEAQIESTVTGNTTTIQMDPDEALCDRTQVFLPTNNALTPVGHVYWYIEELGQGIQHAASRVANLPEFVQRANDYRDITGEGFTFLKIPRTYYGLLTDDLFVNGGVDGELGPKDVISQEDAAAMVHALQTAGLSDSVGAVSLDATEEDLSAALQSISSFEPNKSFVLAVIRRSIYLNLWKLLRHQISEETYITIVRNMILIDVQGEDVLMQIFTSLILQRQSGAEAPFLEIIQRLCAGDGTTPVRAGCGGFGIRNFLTLFLSIEVSKAMMDQFKAAEAGDAEATAFHQKRVHLFTDQLVESNPILTEISDCMTGEGVALAEGKPEVAAQFEARKEEANALLMACSAKYNDLMKNLREEFDASRQ